MSSCLTLKKSNCKNCYKCIRHCPVKSIRFSGNQAHIIEQECILCGQCVVVCPQDAKQIVDESEKVRVLLQSGSPVVVSLAPSFIANYHGAGIEQMRDALKKLGFYDVEETAVGATHVKREYERILKEENRDVVISSCCHSVNLLIQKYFPDLLPMLADVISPMQAHCADIKRRIPDAKTVFIGPCVSKKDEAQHYGDTVDAVLTFEELSVWLKEENIEIERSFSADEHSRARFFPTAGGILKTMDCDLPDYTYIAIDGIEKCISVLRELEKGSIHKCFIEMSACNGSCIGGPVMENARYTPIEDQMLIAGYAGSKDYEVEQPDMLYMKKQFSLIDLGHAQPTESEIRQILAQMGKFDTSDELNCGSCGYNTCREKAIAIYQGKADISMCLPFLKDKAESFSDTIVRNTPNGIIVLNDSLEVQQINSAAMEMMNIRYASDVLGDQVVRILDPKVFMEVKRTGKGVYNERIFLTEYQRYAERTIVLDRESKMLICIMRDVTDEENARSKKEEISRNTIEVADKVIDKQMRIVQEIASLLGETTAETKIALSKLKESIQDE
ncbi:[Fe-Fe] hydrogenase large subunit C-terminal domain-containing protein [Ruminococcus albus]|uniref:Putative PAS/PAC sensor protein n=1 Tax=Ruminococcus albus (strain ATCC 27210 / DSM 20455 / JCM 14654 / NCDO 2250 / 7) TaxID=697329 RepID=E6UJL5_RUMA7|nr:[Fe-Fe] hydrogenase large subunit C-terminal domain-containing protein [Ruminococcus albus]ADU23861.1 putative PAS/PAC sensor protein [Ruminococcus albus 7 = DSM 20455]